MHIIVCVCDLCASVCLGWLQAICVKRCWCACVRKQLWVSLLLSLSSKYIWDISPSAYTTAVYKLTNVIVARWDGWNSVCVCVCVHVRVCVCRTHRLKVTHANTHTHMKCVRVCISLFLYIAYRLILTLTYSAMSYFYRFQLACKEKKG